MAAPDILEGCSVIVSEDTLYATIVALYEPAPAGDLILIIPLLFATTHTVAARVLLAVLPKPIRIEAKEINWTILLLKSKKFTVKARARKKEPKAKTI